VLKKYYAFLDISNSNFLFTAFLSVCFAGFETVGYNIDRYTKLFYPSLTLYTFIFNMLIFFGYFVIFYFLTNLLAKVLERYTNTDVERTVNNTTFLNYNPLEKCPVPHTERLGKFSFLKSKSYSVGYFDKKFKYFSNDTKSIFFVSGALVSFWLIYYLIFFPGVVTQDSYYQIEQGLGFRNLTDENPFVHTLFQGLIISIGSKIFGSINLGISVFCVLQMIFVAFVISFALKSMAKYSVPILFRVASFLFYLLHPLIGIYSVTLWKDIWISSFLLVYSVLLTDLYIDALEFFKSKIKVFWFILVILFVMLSKGTGIIFIFFSFIPLSFKLFKNYFLKLSTIYLIPVVGFFLIRLIIIPCFGIQKGYIREPMSVPLQQIARTVKENKESINQSEQKEINEILPYNELPTLYNPRLSDNVKSEFNEKMFLSNPMKYAKLWAILGIRYPKSYLESFLSNSYGYWYPETKYWIVSDLSYVKMLYFYKKNNRTVYDKNIENYSKDSSIVKDTLCEYLNNHIREVPVISALFSISFYFWLELFIFMFCLKNRKNDVMPMFFIVMAAFITCIMSPVHAEMRYAYPAVIMFPVVFSFSISKLGRVPTNKQKQK
jgi:hypothetical protein